MFTRTTGLLIVPLWLAAMSWLVAHDIWPGLTAQDPPALKVTDWLRNEGSRSQLTITNEHGRLGTIWTIYRVEGKTIRRDDVVWIERFPLDIAPLRIIGESLFTAEGVLDEFTLRLDNPDTAMRLHGERFHADFSFTFECGPLFNTYKVPLIDGGIITDAFNPFVDLGDLHVGRTWRMQVFNPVSVLTGLGDRFVSMLVTVTGEERINTGVWEGNCAVVESEGAKAWVDVRGVVQLQEMTLPLVGKIRIVRESGFDDQGLSLVRRGNAVRFPPRIKQWTTP